MIMTSINQKEVWHIEEKTNKKRDRNRDIENREKLKHGSTIFQAPQVNISLHPVHQTLSL